jgi:hypothetical protein
MFWEENMNDIVIVWSKHIEADRSDSIRTEIKINQEIQIKMEWCGNLLA